jgi:TonB family protein
MSCFLMFSWVLVVFTASITLAQNDSALKVQDYLEGRLAGKILSMRVPHPESHLRFDAAGNLSGKAMHGVNTFDRDIIPESFQIRDKVLHIKASRVLYLWDAKQRSIARSKNGEEVSIDLEFPGGVVSQEGADAALGSLFLSGQEVRSRACSQQEAEAFRKLIETPIEHKDLTKEPEAASKAELPEACFPSGERSRRVARGIKPPKAKFTPDPEYTSSARKAGVQGTATYLVRIDEQGLPTDILLIKGIEPSLNFNGAQALRRWKFDPATFRNEPIPISINVEINFRLN